MDEQPLLLARASQWASQVDGLFFALLGISLLVGVVLAALVIVYVCRYRRGGKGKRRAHYEHEERLEFLWTAVPMVIFFGLFVSGGSTYIRMTAAPPEALQIYAVGKQWMWQFQHPSGRAEINTLHLPLGDAVRITLSSEDVIHSLYLPAFRVKKDAVPGRYTDVWFRPTQTGRYRLMCAEYCGASHAGMQGFVYVVEPERYAEWSAGGPAEDNVNVAGAALFRSAGCEDCHSQSSTVRAPPLEGIFGRRISTDSGLVTADETYLRESILVPDRITTAGYEAVMPAYDGRLSESEILALIAYLKTLHGTKSP